MADKKSIVPVERIESHIYLIRGEKVMLDEDLAELYEVETRALVQAVNRNSGRFPEDFMFRNSSAEFKILRSQIVISRWGEPAKLDAAIAANLKEPGYGG